MGEIEQAIFQLITASGSARSCAFEALEAAKNNEFEKAVRQIETAKKEILEAHRVQTSLIQKESRGEYTKVNLLMVHAQDHLMTSMLAKDLIEKMIDMQKEINDLKQK